MDRQSLREGLAAKGTWAKAERSGGTSQKLTEKENVMKSHTNNEVDEGFQ